VTSPEPETVAPPSSWLFIKDNQSIWVERPRGRLLVVAGPGTEQEQRDFISDEALDQFQMALAERLAGDGWFLWGVNRERRIAADRRRTSRGTTDRRTQRV
jgi:hypothetical protein